MAKYDHIKITASHVSDVPENKCQIYRIKDFDPW